MSIELGILGGGRVNFAHDDETGDWYICRADDSEGFIVWKDKRCARLMVRLPLYVTSCGREFSLLYTISAIIVLLLSVELFLFFNT